MRFELPGATILFRGLDRREVRDVQAELDPYDALEAAGDADADVRVEPATHPPASYEDIQNPSNDGRVTASDGTRLHVVDRGLSCTLPRLDRGLPFVFERQPGFPLGPLVRSALRPALQLALLERGGVAVHGTTIDRGGSGIVVAGWSESGKTETALAFLELGARFVSDKWTVVTAGRELASFPISVGIRRWVLRHLPRLRRELPLPARIQLGAAGAAAILTAPLRRGRHSGRVTRLLATSAEDAIALAERASLTPSQVSRVYGEERPLMRTELGAFVLLTTVPDADVSVRTIDADWAARRLARSAAYERRGFFELHRRARYSFADSVAELESAVEAREEALLRDLLDGAPLLEARAPFPTDPRRVAEAIASRL